MKFRKIFLVSMILLAILTVSAACAADNITADDLATPEIDDSISESVDEEITEDILQSSADDSVLSAKKDSGMEADFVTQDDDDEIYPIDETSDILADNYKNDYVRVKFPQKVSGKLSFYIDDKSIVNRTITKKVHYFYVNEETYNLTVGTHSWKMIYSGDDNYTSASQDGTFNLTVKNESGINISFVKQYDDGNISTIDENKDLYVNDHDSDYVMIRFPKKVSGTLSLYIDKKLVAEKEITGRTHYLFVNTKSYGLAEGNHTWKVRYTGDETYKSEVLYGNFTLNPASDSFVKKNPKMQVYLIGTAYTNETTDEFEAERDDEYFKVKFPKEVSGTLSLYIDGKFMAEKKITAKTHYLYANLEDYKISKGAHNWEIRYSGDDEYASSSTNGTFEVNKTTKKVKLQKKTPTMTMSKTKTYKTKLYTKKYTVTMKYNKKPLKKVNVILTIKGKNYKKTIKTKTNNKGVATFSIKGLKKVGTYTGTVKYGGNKNYRAVTTKLTIKITKKTCKITRGKKTVDTKVQYTTETVTNYDCNGFIDVSEAYEILNAFRAEEGVWQWNKDNVGKTYFNTNASNMLKTLEISPIFEEVAQTRAKELVESYSHTRPDGNDTWTAYPALGSGYYPTGENIAMKQKDCKEVMEAWKETKELYEKQGHRRNMLNPTSDYVGIAGYKYNGVIYWVQSFGRDFDWPY